MLRHTPLAALLVLSAALSSCQTRPTGGTGPGHPHQTIPCAGVPSHHATRHGGVMVHSGDVHVELLVEPDGTVRVWGLNEEGNPIDPRALEGTVSYRPEGGALSTLPLRPTSNLDGLMAEGLQPVGPATDYTVELRYRGYVARGGMWVPPGGTAAPTAVGGGPRDPAPPREASGSRGAMDAGL